MPRDAEINAAIGRALRMRRRTIGLTQRAVADAIGVTWVQLHKYEHGTAGVSAERLCRLAVVLRCSPGDLLGEPDPYEHPGARRLVDAWSRLAAPEQRRAMLDLLEALGARGRGQRGTRPVAETPAAPDAPPTVDAARRRRLGRARIIASRRVADHRQVAFAAALRQGAA